MDETVVQRIMEHWRLATWPIRPDAARVDSFRLALPGASSVLVMGATPELIDMLLTEVGVDRVAAIDLHAETMEAMRRLAGQDWARVECVVGDWRTLRPAWDSAFDGVFCDGGLMFLPFPDGWRDVLAVIHTYLRPNGGLVATLSSMSPTAGSFRDHYERVIATFDSELQALDPEPRARRFGELVSRIKGLVRVGAVDTEGRVQLDVAASAHRWMADDLRRRYPGLDRLIEAMFGRLSLVGGDGATMVAMPALERVTAEMVRSGFEVEVLASRPNPPRHSYTIRATCRR